MTPDSPSIPYRFKPRGFTLVELLIVLGIVVLLLAGAIPAFNYITGSRSTDAAENMVSAMLVRARSQAVQAQRTTGVVFFVNPRDGRSTMAIVTSPSAASDEGSYIGWTTAAIQPNGTNAAPVYSPTHVVTSTVYDNISKKLVVGQFVNVDANTSGSQANPGTKAPDKPPAPGTPWTNTYWNYTGSDSLVYLDFQTDGDFEVLPAGVAVQLINDPSGQTQRDRYVQTGVVLFDSQGRLISTPFAFSNPGPVTNTGRSAITRLLNIDPVTFPEWPKAPPVTVPVTPEFHSQVGVVIYDRPTFLNQSGHTEGDFSLLVQGIPSLPSPPGGGGGALQEANEEAWIDQNTTPLLVNRYNGTLMRGQ